MKTLKIYFTDFWANFDVTDNFIYRVLAKKYDIIIDEKRPDYLFFSCFSPNHLKYKKCVKIFFTGENIVPDFNLCDYALGFDHLTFGDRYLRLPLYVVTQHFNTLYDKNVPSDEWLLNRKFCNFVYTNGDQADPVRLQFFKKLSEYKQVDSGGQLENNIGHPVENKLDFISNYKFTIAFENSAVDGYTTEKLMQPMQVNSLPIYWGNPSVHKDFNLDAIIYLKNHSEVNKAIEEVIRLDNDDAAYLEKLKKPWLINDTYKHWEEVFSHFLEHIVEQNKEDALKRPRYGFRKQYVTMRYF